jgi:DNA-binding MarR family transcriptional regulator
MWEQNCQTMPDGIIIIESHVCDDCSRGGARRVRSLTDGGIDELPLFRDTSRSGRSVGRGTGRVRALMSLADGPLGLAELAQAIGVDPPYATIIVNELHALGLVSRTPDTRDRRRKTVELTASGGDAVHKAQDIIARPPPPLRDMPAADLVRLREILEQLKSS